MASLFMNVTDTSGPQTKRMHLHYACFALLPELLATIGDVRRGLVLAPVTSCLRVLLLWIPGQMGALRLREIVGSHSQEMIAKFVCSHVMLGLAYYLLPMIYLALEAVKCLVEEDNPNSCTSSSYSSLVLSFTLLTLYSRRLILGCFDDDVLDSVLVSLDSLSSFKMGVRQKTQVLLVFVSGLVSMVMLTNLSKIDELGENGELLPSYPRDVVGTLAFTHTVGAVGVFSLAIANMWDVFRLITVHRRKEEGQNLSKTAKKRQKRFSIGYVTSKAKNQSTANLGDLV